MSTLAEFSYGLSTLSVSILKKAREEAAKTHQYSSAETEAPSGRQRYRCPSPKPAGSPGCLIAYMRIHRLATEFRSARRETRGASDAVTNADAGAGCNVQQTNNDKRLFSKSGALPRPRQPMSLDIYTGTSPCR
ncbi:predicted protein [Postia placenta Mad-698-R]|nr:predicted protein [Postia placenta Mad-698-R]